MKRAARRATPDSPPIGPHNFPFLSGPWIVVAARLRLLGLLGDSFGGYFFGSIARNSVAIMLLMVSVGCLSCVGLWGAPWCVLLCLSFSLAKVSLGLRNVLRQEDQTISTRHDT